MIEVYANHNPVNDSVEKQISEIHFTLEDNGTILNIEQTEGSDQLLGSQLLALILEIYHTMGLDVAMDIDEFTKYKYNAYVRISVDKSNQPILLVSSDLHYVYYLNRPVDVTWLMSIKPEVLNAIIFYICHVNLLDDGVYVLAYMREEHPYHLLKEMSSVLRENWTLTFQ